MVKEVKIVKEVKKLKELKGLAAQSKAKAIGRSSLGLANQKPGFHMTCTVISLTKSDAQTC